MGAEFYTDGRTEAIFAFRNFANAPKNRQAMVRYRREGREEDFLESLDSQRTAVLEEKEKEKKKKKKTYCEPDGSTRHPPSVFILDSF